MARVKYTVARDWQRKIELPLSKSMGARLMCLEYLCGRDVAGFPADCRDLEVLRTALSTDKTAGIASGEVWLDASGTAMRLLVAMISAMPEVREVRLSGTPRLMARPMAPLLEALERLGAPPVRRLDAVTLSVRGAALRSRGQISIDASESSQYVTALMLIGPLIEGGLQLRLTGRPVSMGYARMTAAMMRRYGAHVEMGTDFVRVAPGGYAPPAEPMPMEPDASAATYFMELCAIERSSYVGIYCGESACKRPCGNIQPDAYAVPLFEKIAHMGAGEELRADCRAMPDAVPSLVMACAGRGLGFSLAGTAHLQYKESRRLDVLSQMLAPLGVKAVVEGDLFRAEPAESSPLGRKIVCASDDHRMVMAAAPLAAAGVEVGIVCPLAVEKSFPRYWQEMAKAGIELAET